MKFREWNARITKIALQVVVRIVGGWNWFRVVCNGGL
jgi:hypothetical protein